MKKLIMTAAMAIIVLTGCSSEDIDKVKDTVGFFTDRANSSNESSDAVSTFDPNGEYTLTEVDACDLSGDRSPNSKVDIGMDTDYANRDYFAYTNEIGQLVHVEAADIVIQSDDNESNYEKGDGRYCSDEAKVSGVEASDLDEGHAIADSLGGVSNAYNITPQNSTLNRSGEQYDMEEDIRGYEATGHDVTNFSYDITYADQSMTPSSYSGSYNVDGDTITFAFDNE